MDLTKRRRRLNGNEPDVDRKRLSCRLERRVSLFPFPAGGLGEIKPVSLEGAERERKERPGARERPERERCDVESALVALFRVESGGALKNEEEEEKTHSLDPREQSRERETTQGGGRDSMPLNRQLLRKVQELLFVSLGDWARGTTQQKRKRRCSLQGGHSNASASGSASMTFASSPIPSSVQRSAPIVASLSWHDWSDHIDPLRRGSGTSSLPGGAGAAYRRSFFTRTPLLPLPAVAAGGGERKKKRHSSSSDRRRVFVFVFNHDTETEEADPSLGDAPAATAVPPRAEAVADAARGRGEKIFFPSFFDLLCRRRCCSSFTLSFQNLPHEKTAPSPRGGHPSGDPRDHE